MKTRHWVPLFLLLTLLLHPVHPGAGAAAPALTLLAPAGPQPATGVIDVPVRITGATNLGAIEFDLTYDRSLVQVSAVTAGDYLGVNAGCDPDAARCAVALGPVDRADTTSLGAYAYGTGSGASGDGIVAVLHLTPAGKAGTTSLHVTNPLVVDATANPTTPTTQDATLVLTLAKYWLYLPLVWRNAVTASRLTGERGGEGTRIADARATAPDAATLGCPDFDGDGWVDADDVLAAASQWRQRSTDAAWEGRYDLDGDGRISIVDIVRVDKEWDRLCQALPPDPATVAPGLDRTRTTCLADATSFLYTGSAPIQTGVVSNTIACQSGAVLRGRVLTRAGTPLAGVVLRIHRHPEYGQTLSRANGMFDLAVNGGGPLTVEYRKEGYLPAQRTLQVPWQDYAWLPDVVLIPIDGPVTTIDLSDPTPIQVARGRPVSDGDGSRQATLLVPQGTQAELVLPGGVTQTLTSLDLQATEYTVGEGGPAAMPGELPPQSGYTYALEYSVDEALDAGATEVRFNQPLIHYVENFLGFPVGMAVPTGYYAREQAAWLPADNGRVIQVLSVSGGLADLDVDGSGSPADAQALAELGVTEAEREQLASLYAPGQSLWRVPMTHLTPWDCNWPYGPPRDATPANGGPPRGDDEDCPAIQGGSAIECQNQTLREALKVTGTPFRLHYASDRVPGRTVANTLDIPLSGDGVPDSLKRIELEVEVAGQQITQTFPAAPNASYTFTWNGKDSYGRRLQGAQPVRVRIGYVYDAVYQEPAQLQQAFSAFSGVPMTGNRARREITLWQVWQGAIGPWDAQATGLGGWTLSVHHAYDLIGRVLYLGNGQRRSARNMNSIITTVAGDGTFSYGGDGGPATKAQLSYVHEIDVGPDGSLTIADGWNHRIRRVAPDGTISTVAGNGEPCSYLTWPCGEGSLATEAEIGYPYGVTIDPEGGFYIVSVEPSRVRHVGSDGIIRTIAGTAANGYGGDGGPATEAQLWRPSSAALDTGGSLYIADTYNHRIRRVAPDGIITTVAGTGTYGYSGDGGPAALAQLYFPEGVAVGPDGALYIADTGNHRVRRVGLDGIISTVAGNGTRGDSGNGGPATQAQIDSPARVAVGPDGILYIADRLNHRLYQVGPNGDLTIRAGDGTQGYGGDHGPSAAAHLAAPRGIGVGSDGNLYIGDSANFRVRKVSPAFPGMSDSDLVIASEDGAELYVLDKRGRHLSTLDALTGATRYAFSYDGAGRLTTVTDGDGNRTTVERDAAGRPTAIRSPYGQRTLLALGADGYLASITNPANETTRFSYTDDGLLVRLTTPRAHAYNLAYDDLGRLVRDDGPAGGSQLLARSDDGAGYVVTRTTALQRSTAYRVQPRPTGDRVQINTWPDGSQSELLVGTDGSRAITETDGTVITLTAGPDPRWGMLSPRAVSQTTTTPGGQRSVVTAQRSVSLSDPNNLLSLTVLTDVININSRAYSSVYDAASRTFTMLSPEGRQSRARVDALGRVILEQVSGVAPISYTYDARGRLAGITQESGQEARGLSLGYNSAGYLETLADTGQHQMHLVYDGAGRVAQQTLPGSRVVGYGYDTNGNLARVTPPGQPAHLFTYTPVDLVGTYTPPDVGADSRQTVYTYNADRQLARVARPDGRNVDLGYDRAGRVISMTLARGTVRYAYNPATGQLTTITAPDGGALSYSYDGSLLTQTTWSGPVAGSVHYGYDQDRRVGSLSVNGANPIALQYDRDGLLTGAGDLSLSYHAQNGLLTGTVLSDVRDSWRYNAFAEPVGYDATYDGAALYAVTYVRDKLGRIVGKRETIGGITTIYSYTYSLAQQLAQVRENGSLVASYVYDANGNRLSYSHPGGTISGTYDAQDRLLRYGSTTYLYTENGELSSKTDGDQVTTYQYDELGNLVTVRLPDTTQIEYVIDGQNRRVGKRVNGSLVQGYLYQDELNPIAELDESGNVVSRFVYGSRDNVPDAMIKGGVTYRILADHLGSPRLVVDGTTGVVVQRMDYDTFGNVVQDTNPGFQPFGFAGGLYDPHTRLTRYGARDYDAEVGRWTIKDPIGLAGGTNSYLYVENDPVNSIDPRGLLPPKSCFKIVKQAVDCVDTGLACKEDLGEVETAEDLGDYPYASSRNFSEAFGKNPECDALFEQFQECLKDYWKGKWDKLWDVFSGGEP